MIARLWHGRTPAAKADEYLEYVKQTGVAGQRRSPGNMASLVLRRTEGEEAHFWVLSIWKSMDAVRAFAGATPEVAVYYPRDDEYLLEREPHVEHYEFAAGEWT